MDNDYDGPGDRLDHNTHRSLRQLVAIEAWFRQSSSDKRRYTLHASVTFDVERLGAGEGANLRFRLAVKKCEVVFLTPSSGFFGVDPSSVRSPKPLRPHEVETLKKTTRAIGGRIGLSIKGLMPSPSGDAEASAKRETSSAVASKQEVSPYLELSKRSVDNHRAWSLDGRFLPDGRLWGPVWDAEQEPRLTVVDNRPDAVMQKDADMGFPPLSRIEVRCLREDIDIYDIQFKDAEEDKQFRRKLGHQARIKAAEAFLRQQILREGLRVGDLSDRFSELTILDTTIPISDAGDF